MVKSFANAPRATGFFHLTLKITACHVQAHGIAKNMLVSVGGLNIFTAFANGHDQLDFVVQVVGEAGVGHRAGLARFNSHDAIRGLEEKKRRLAAGKTHFLGVFFVIAADAINTVNGKARRSAVDGYRHGGRRSDDKVL